jgi:CRISPR/Cas system-associated exonuclease Cas4 (RecB family)
MMGIVVQRVLELMYNDEHWKDPKNLKDNLLKLLNTAFKAQLDKSYIDWKAAPSEIEMFDICKNGVLGYIQTMKAYRLLGPYSRAEVEVTAHLDKYTPIGEKMDFLIKRPDTGITILDGKNSKQKGKYCTPVQLLYYAMCYYQAYKEIPNRIGFVYYRFPYGMESESGVEQGVEWIPFTYDDLKDLASKVITAYSNMTKKKFDPNPVPPYCKFCDYESICQERQDQIISNRRVPKEGVPLPAGSNFEFGDL